MHKREIEVVIISDVHLGTYGCHATELLNYLRSVSPRILILNGDIIDIWNFRKRYFPPSHFEVLNEIIQLAANGCRVIYITGNHDEMMRRYSDLELGTVQVCDKLLMEVNGKMCWIFHGDVFDATTKGSAKLIAKLGGKGYDLLILLNRFINWNLRMLGREKMSLSKKVKNGVKKAVAWIGNFEQTAAELAIEKGYDYVICGHIHQPQKRAIKTEDGSVWYLNSGDWIENLTALEYYKLDWHIFTYHEKDFDSVKIRKKKPIVDVSSASIDVYLHTLAPLT